MYWEMVGVNKHNRFYNTAQVQKIKEKQLKNNKTKH